MKIKLSASEQKLFYMGKNFKNTKNEVFYIIPTIYKRLDNQHFEEVSFKDLPAGLKKHVVENFFKDIAEYIKTGK